MKQVARRQIAFKVIAVISPLLFVLLLELLLRGFHYGYNTHLFIEDPHRPGIVNTNTHVSNVFFANTRDAKLGIPQSFKKVKSPGTFRIFVLGESSGIGFPYSPRVSFPRLLEARLSRTFPESSIEMINLSITAINSYAFLKFADEIADMKPNAILIYGGHNEYYGALGAGSSNPAGSDRRIIKMLIRLRNFKVSQLVLNLSGSFSALLKGKSPVKDEGFMHRMAEKQKIIYGSDLYQRGIDQFKSNMDELLTVFNKQKVPVFLSNLVCNEKDQKPFISVLKNSTDTTAFFKEFRRGNEYYLKHEYDSSLIELSACNRIDSGYAMNNFLMAAIYYLKGDYSLANRYYSSAKESDGLRFRAPQAINDELLHLSKKYSNVHFVDTKKEFIDNSFKGIPDNRLFLDHLHPNMFGYFLIADAFYYAILEARLIGIPDKVIPTDIARIELPVSAVDSIYGSWMSLVLKKQWPFFENSDFNPDTINSYPQKLTLMMITGRIKADIAMDSLYRYYVKKKNLDDAFKMAASMALDHPHDWRYSAQAGSVCDVLKSYEESVYYYTKSFKEFPDVGIAKKIVFDLLQLDRPDQVRRYLEYILQKYPDDRISKQLFQEAEQVIMLKKMLISDPYDSRAIFGLADYYLFIKNKEELKKYVDKASSKYRYDKRTVKLLAEYSKLLSGS